MKRLQNWLIEVLVAFDQLLNALLFGSSDETLSSRAFRMRLKGHRYTWWLADVIDAIFFWDDDHCRKAYESELKRRNLAVGWRL